MLTWFGKKIEILFSKIELTANFLISQPKHMLLVLKTGLNETVLLSSQNICKNKQVKKCSQFYAQINYEYFYLTFLGLAGVKNVQNKKALPFALRC